MLAVVLPVPGWSDIGYSFLVGGDGKVYEGRGWNHVGAHTSGYNSEGIGKANLQPCTTWKLCLRACVCHVTMMFRSSTSWCCFRHLRDRRLHPRHPDLRAVGRRPGSHSVRSQERRHQVLVRTEGSSRRVLIDVSRRRSVRHHPLVAALLEDDLHTAPTTTYSSGRPDVNCSNKQIYIDLSYVASYQYPPFFQCVVANIANVVQNVYLT